MCSGCPRGQLHCRELYQSQGQGPEGSAEGLKVRWSVVLALVLLLTSCMAFGKSPHLSVPQFPHLKK